MTYEPSSYWKHLAEESNRYLAQYGYENFKITVGSIYNDYCVEYNFETKTKVIDYEKYKGPLKNLWDQLYKSYPKELLDRFHEPLEGNPLGVEYGGRVVSFDLAASIMEYHLFSRIVGFDKIKSINEIGGGYGRVPWVIKQMHPEITYKMYDIEPSLSLTTRYLNSVLPNSGIEFLSPDKLYGKCDLLIAMDCLHEMNTEQVNTYFDYADKNAKYFYYTCWKETDVKEHGISWKKADYPVRQSWEPIYVGQHRMRPDFFEAVYKICQE